MTSPTERALAALEQALAGREDHPGECVIRTVYLRQRRELVLEWHDERTGEQGPLATFPAIPPCEPEIAAVLSALQEWRRRAETRKRLQRRESA